MLFSLLPTAFAAVIVTTYPCQRLGWAWRNVWVTCGIDARVPGDIAIPTAASPLNADSPNYNEGFNFQGKNPYNTANGEKGDLEFLQSPHSPILYGGANGIAPQFDGGIFANAATYAPHTWGFRSGIWNTAADAARRNAFCAAVGTPGGAGQLLGFRTACRRSIDLYGSLLELCRNPVRARTPLAGATVAPSGTPAAGRLFFGTTAIWRFATPGVEHIPHASNVQLLSFFAQQCVTPAQVPLGPLNSCPGLTGWWTVAYQACNVANQFSTAGWVLTPAITPNIDPVLTTGGTKWQSFLTPTDMCGTAATSATNWHPSGPTFHRSACRRALDQFTRTAARCTHFATMVPAQSALRNLGVEWGKLAPSDCA